MAIFFGSTLFLAPPELQARQFSPPPADFAEFLVARDLVVVGSVAKAEFLRRLAGEDGPESVQWLSGIHLVLQVDQVWFGTAEDSTIEVRVARGSEVPPAGTRLLVWAHREPEDAWRLWGNFAFVSESGIVRGQGSDNDFVRLRGQPEGKSPHLEEARLWAANTTFEHSTANIEGAVGLGLGVLRGVRDRPSGGYTIEVDSLGVVLGDVGSVPRFIDVPLATDCYPEILPGDSLLVPVARGSMGDRIMLKTCPRALGIKHGYLPGFGVPLRSIEQAIAADSSGFRTRKFSTASKRRPRERLTPN